MSTDAPDDADRGRGGRDVVVPERVYKTVTVFSTLIAVLLVVVGFVVLDGATNRATLSLDRVDPALAVLGLACIAGGAAVYAFASRFRAEGMGKDKDDEDESLDDG